MFDNMKCYIHKWIISLASRILLEVINNKNHPLMDQQLKNWFMQEKIAKVIWHSTWPMFGAILALLAYDLLESSLLALNGEQALTALGFTLPITTAITAIAIGMSIITNNKVIKYACLHSHELAKSVVISLLQASFFIILFSVVFYFALCIAWHTVRPTDVVILLKDSCVNSVIKLTVAKKQH